MLKNELFGVLLLLVLLVWRIRLHLQAVPSLANFSTEVEVGRATGDMRSGDLLFLSNLRMRPIDVGHVVLVARLPNPRQLVVWDLNAINGTCNTWTPLYNYVQQNRGKMGVWFRMTGEDVTTKLISNVKKYAHTRYDLPCIVDHLCLLCERCTGFPRPPVVRNTSTRHMYCSEAVFRVLLDTQVMLHRPQSPEPDNEIFYPEFVLRDPEILNAAMAPGYRYGAPKRLRVF